MKACNHFCEIQVLQTCKHTLKKSNIYGSGRFKSLSRTLFYELISYSFSTGHTNSQVILKMFYSFSMLIISATIYFKMCSGISLNFFKVCFIIEFLSIGNSCLYK